MKQEKQNYEYEIKSAGVERLFPHAVWCLLKKCSVFAVVFIISVLFWGLFDIVSVAFGSSVKHFRYDLVDEFGNGLTPKKLRT